MPIPSDLPVRAYLPALKRLPLRVAAVHLLAIGGSDGGISAALRARELDPSVDVTVMLADAYPNYSICGIPYYLSGDVTDWHDLAHRTRADIEGLGINLLTETRAEHIDITGHTVATTGADGRQGNVAYDRLVIATGAVPARPPIDGLDRLGPDAGVHLLHTIGDTHTIVATLTRRPVKEAVIIGAGYIGLEMAEGLTARGVQVTQVEQLAEVLPTVDAEFGALVSDELRAHSVEVRTSTRVDSLERKDGRLVVHGTHTTTNDAFDREADLVLVVTGVRPDTELAASAGADLSPRGAIVVDRHMRTGLPDIYAAGDCVITHHVILGETYLPLGTTAHKQGRIAGENAIGGSRAFVGSTGTQVVKVFDLVAARTGLRDAEVPVGSQPLTVSSTADDHKAYYPGARTVHVRTTADTITGRLLGVQMVGAVPTAVHKRIDTAAVAIFNGNTIGEISDLDLSYTPPLGSPWDVLQAAAQTWTATALRTRSQTQANATKDHEAAHKAAVSPRPR